MRKIDAAFNDKMLLSHSHDSIWTYKYRHMNTDSIAADLLHALSASLYHYTDTVFHRV